MIRHHRKLLRRLRATYPRAERRGVCVVRGRGWCVVTGRVERCGWVLAPGRTLAWDSKRATALELALRARRAELGGRA